MKSGSYITLNISTRFFMKVGKLLLLLLFFTIIVISTVYYKPYLSITVLYLFTILTSLIVSRFYSSLERVYMLTPFVINVFVWFITMEQAKQIADMAAAYQSIKKMLFLVGSNFVISVILTKLYLKRRKEYDKTS